MGMWLKALAFFPEDWCLPPMGEANYCLNVYKLTYGHIYMNNIKIKI